MRLMMGYDVVFKDISDWLPSGKLSFRIGVFNHHANDLLIYFHRLRN